MQQKSYKRIIKFIALTYALPFGTVWNTFERTNSIDTVIKLAEDGTLEKISA